MKISKKTLDVMKNFATINNSIFFDESNIIKTMSLASNIIGVGDIEEEFPKFGIYNLGEFLGVISLFDLENTEFDFKDKYVLIKSGRNKVKYVFTDMDLLPLFGKIKPAQKYKDFDKFNTEFTLSESDIDKITRASSIMKLTHIDIDMTDGKGTLKIAEEDTPMSNSFKIDIEGEGSCKISFNVENLVLIKNDYKVKVMDKKLIKFINQSQPLFYFISPKV